MGYSGGVRWSFGYLELSSAPLKYFRESSSMYFFQEISVEIFWGFSNSCGGQGSSNCVPPALKIASFALFSFPSFLPLQLSLRLKDDASSHTETLFSVGLQGLRLLSARGFLTGLLRSWKRFRLSGTVKWLVSANLKVLWFYFRVLDVHLDLITCDLGCRTIYRATTVKW